MNPLLVMFQDGDHTINVLEISHWSFQAPTVFSRDVSKELVVFMKNGHAVRFTGCKPYEVEKKLKAFCMTLNGVYP